MRLGLDNPIRGVWIITVYWYRLIHRGCLLVLVKSLRLKLKLVYQKINRSFGKSQKHLLNLKTVKYKKDFKIIKLIGSGKLVSSSLKQ